MRALGGILFALMVAVAVAAIMQWPDIQRYLKMRSM